MLERPDGFIPHMPNCGVTALAIVTKQPFGMIWDYLAIKNKMRGNWKGRTFPRDYPATMAAFGVNFKIAPDGMLVRGFADWHTLPDRTYFVRISGHVFLLRNGVVFDNTSNHKKSVACYGRRRVKQAWEILE